MTNENIFITNLIGTKRINTLMSDKFVGFATNINKITMNTNYIATESNSLDVLAR